jgi:hypothetical protein
MNVLCPSWGNDNENKVRLIQRRFDLLGKFRPVTNSLLIKEYPSLPQMIFQYLMQLLGMLNRQRPSIADEDPTPKITPLSHLTPPNHTSTCITPN